MDRNTGKPLDDLGHLFQSIRDILTTPTVTRVERRDYGSDLPGFVDRPMSPDLTVDIYAAVAQALDRWEPRFRLTFVKATFAAAGRLSVDVRGVYRPTGREITLEGVVG